jgi:tripartite-type tricarboxylate transporter receptor subunit TctC
MNPRLAICISVAGLMIAVAGETVYGQNYPNRPIRVITSLPGGGSDVTLRLIAPGISSSLGQPVVIENRPSNLTGEIVARALPDGYTWLIDGGGLWITPLLQKTPYDVMKDFSPVSLVSSSPNVIVVHPSVPANSVSELIALAKAKPGALNFGSAGQGSSPHLAAELFKSMTGVNMVHIPFKGAGPAVVDLLGGQIQLMFASAASIMPSVKAGKLRAFAVTTAQPSQIVPGLPTIASSGLPGYDAATLIGMFVPAKTPAAIIQRINQDAVRSLNQPDIKDKLASAGAEVVGNTPEEFMARLKSELAKWGKVIKDANIRID